VGVIVRPWLLGVALLGASALCAQEGPGRPNLARSADRNDWTAYFDYGAAAIRSRPRRADSAFYWASRLDPSRGEPLFGRWVAFWLQDIGRFEAYLEEIPSTLTLPEVVRADSFYRRSLERNPFVPQNLRVLPYAALPGEWLTDVGTQGWLAYAKGDYRSALERFGRLVIRNPQRYVGVHYYRALAFVPMHHFDSAGAEMQTLISTLRRRDTTGTTSHVYESKELVEYGIGLLARAQGDGAGARAAFERSLAENLGFAPAHAELGDLAFERRDWVAAAAEYGLAVELAPSDGWMRFRYGSLLANIGRPADAVPELKLAIELEPYFADPYLALSAALEATGEWQGAMRAIEDYLARAPRRATELIARAQRRLTVLRSGK
jgi:hypothetical protein